MGKRRALERVSEPPTVDDGMLAAVICMLRADSVNGIRTMPSERTAPSELAEAGNAISYASVKAESAGNDGSELSTRKRFPVTATLPSRALTTLPATVPTFELAGHV